MPTASDVEIRRATVADVSRLGVVGPAAYADSYAYLWDDPANFARQLDTFGPSAFAELIAREGAFIWVAESGGDIFGFLTMIAGSLDPIRRQPGGAELARVYLLRPAQRLRVGRKLLEAAVSEAAAIGASYVWLDVMASANEARRAYINWGFQELGPGVFRQPVAPGMADMVILAKSLRCED
jgi:GNAT superfamily N-acetyltransferase